MPITTNVVSSIPTHRGVLDITLCGKVSSQWFATGRCFFPDTTVSSTNKTDRHYITEILLKMALNTITLTPTLLRLRSSVSWMGDSSRILVYMLIKSVHDLAFHTLHCERYNQWMLLQRNTPSALNSIAITGSILLLVEY